MASKNGRVRATGNTASASASLPRLRRKVALSVSSFAAAAATTSWNGLASFSCR